jgi:type II secretory pathway component GspD/PulD (secretin)
MIRPSLLLIAVLLLALTGVRPAFAQADQAAKPAASPRPGKGAAAEAAGLRFTFVRAPWQDVLQWLADRAELALHVSDLPAGSFTYSDKRTYSPEEALDRINLFLIPQRYSLVRSGRLLSVVNLDDEASLRQLDAMAELVEPGDLAHRNPYELVKCLLPLGEVQPEQAISDLGALLLIREPVLLRNTNQLLLTETAGKLRSVQRVLAALSSSGAGGPIRAFPLGDRDAERVLAQVRPHVGVEPLAMSGPEISFSIDQEGRQLLVSGSQEKLGAVAGVIKSLPSTVAAAGQHSLVFRPHPLGAADLQTVMNVLQTLLAREDVRLAPDAKSNQIALMATADVHALVEKTIQQLTTADAVEFKAIALGPVDPRYAVSVLSAMFTSAPGSSGTTTAANDLPKIDADPSTGRLFVRGRGSQIAEIERILAQLGPSTQGHDSLLRILPYRGERGRRILESAARFWPHAEPLLIFPPSEDKPPQPLEREINPQPERRGDSQGKQGDTDSDRQNEPAAAGRGPESRAAPQIRGQVTPHGILIQSDNAEALNRFEQHLRLIAGPEGPGELRLAIFYLKHSAADEADRLLRRLLDAESASSASYPTVLSNRGLLGSLTNVGMSPEGLGGAWSFATATIIADKRLNRMFVYGQEGDLAKVEHYLELVDRESSIADVRTHGTPRVIQLAHARAEKVAAVIRDAYAGRIGATAEERQQAAQQIQRQQQNPQDRRADQAPPQAPPPVDTSEAPKMTLAINAAGNSLIVTAPSQLADEVERLALHLDRQAAQVVRVVALKGTDTVYLRDALSSLFGDRIQTSPSRAAAPATQSSPAPARVPPPAAMQPARTSSR